MNVSRRGGRRVSTVVAALAGSLILASCAGGSSGGGSSADTGSDLSIGMVNQQDAAGDPTAGGTLTFSGYTAVTALDPAKVQVSGAAGGSELAAIYDVLMRYDPVEQAFVPKLAQSLDSNPEATVWTLKLRDGVTFSDGTPLDAKAVVDSINRYVTNKGPQSALWAAKVTSMDAPDASTVVFHLGSPWTGIQSMLSTGPGMIVAASAQQGATFTPVGAGAFTLEKFVPNDEIVLAARPDYHAGKPNLDKLRLVSIVGGQATSETLRAGGIDAAYVRTLEPVLDLIADGYPGFVDIPSLGYLANVNMAPGRPGADLRVRQAMALAIDPEVLNGRVNDGRGMPGQVVFQDTSRWHNDVAPIGVAPEKAKQLLAEAKADGFDGKVAYLSQQEPSAQATALAVQSMLNSVGFDTTIDYVASSSDLLTRMYVEHDYDMATASGSLPDADPYERLFTGLQSSSVNNVLNYRDAETDALLEKLGVAVTDDDKKAVLAQLQERFDVTQPWLVWGNVPVLDVWGQNVHGIVPTIDGIVLFDQAWKN